ncbi:glutamine synthetase family protein [Pseudomonas sp. JS3066]|jgi:glutamine synthetase|uniref:glutamine synthetase family protein n=1 Tax=unclassified Pseudomonas TaxID=196821 RepID=UPI000EA9C2C0|nr:MULTISPECIES: glutamine synthetase family protein [unclassified Pseudomonas]AYF88873.1 glutamine synthetase [Pseudomonas sp. DY-1]MDH4653404.1 glutamine synthetase [Pseudomonas sp. BN606]MRK22364.1 glutamine synthetase [Pseudomonas sp. JG-B]WVK93585.1 glutamine synthetase family protein [Pseudomonas sp. JS3066]
MTTTNQYPDLLSEVRAFRAQYPEVRYIDLICLDIPGHFYGKRYPVEMVEKVAAGSPLKVPQNCVLLGTQGGLYPIGDYCFADGDPDAPRRLVPGTLKPVRWEKEPLGQMLITSDGTEAPIEFEPREVLARVLQRLEKRGIRPVVAFELEFYLFDRKLQDGLPQFPRDPLCEDEDDQPNMHIERLSRFSSVLHEMVDAANEQGVAANVITAELGPGQFEINFGHCDDGLKAADWAALFCRSTRGVALKHGQRASFMSKPYLNAPGSGMHVHVSLYDRDGNNLLAANDQRPLRHAVAGCLDLLPHCMPIFAANHNAFRRYGAMVNAASRASWGFEDRDACIRIPESDGRNLRIEHRLAGADANPYLVLAAILSGMEHGLDAAREPIAPLNEDRESGIDFPKDMLTAVAAMRSHPAVNEGLGSEFVMVYCENKRQEYLDFMNEVSAREYRWYM